MKVVFMGTPDFAVGTLEAIIEAGHDVRAVITQPDKPKGRGKEMSMPPVKETALKYNIPVVQPVKVRTKEFIDEVKSFEADVIVVVAFGRILVPEIINMPKYGCINVHASLLPKYRGAAPIQCAVVNGDKESGVTTMLMNEGLDTGDILLQEVVTLAENETGGSLFDKLACVGASLLVKTLEGLERGEITPVAQDDAKATHVAMIKKEDGRIDFNKSAYEIECLVRGFNPWPSAYTFLNGKMLKVWSASVSQQEYEGTPGQIVELTKDAIVVKTKDKALLIKELQLEGKKRMPADAFLRGVQLECGMVLG